MLEEAFFAGDEIQVILVGNLQGDRLMAEAQKFRLVTQLAEVESQVSIFALVLRDPRHREEEARLSTVVVFEEHVRVPVRANGGLESVINFLVNLVTIFEFYSRILIP